MREIKFRAWDKENKVECEVLAIRWDITGGLQVALPLLEKVSGLRWLHISKVELREFTGLKDKNGKEIFERDIVKLIQHTYYFTHTAIFEVTIPKIYLIDDIKHRNSEIEVIGNIYENPELLEEQK